MNLVGSKVYNLFFLDLDRLGVTPEILFRCVYVSHFQKLQLPSRLRFKAITIVGQ
jgi:hypothetical protein